MPDLPPPGNVHQAVRQAISPPMANPFTRTCKDTGIVAEQSLIVNVQNHPQPDGTQQKGRHGFAVRDATVYPTFLK